MILHFEDGFRIVYTKEMERYKGRSLNRAV